MTATRRNDCAARNCFALRSALPKLKKREFYESDLIGLNARDGQARITAKSSPFIITAAARFSKIAPPEVVRSMLPFTQACAPEVDVEEGHILIAPPEGWLKLPRHPGASRDPARAIASTRVMRPADAGPMGSGLRRDDE